MGFIYERIQEEENKRLVSMGLLNPYTRQNEVSLYMGTVDRERNLYLIGIGTGRGIKELEPEFLYFVKNYEKMLIEGYRELVNGEIHWDIRNIEIPNSMKFNKNEIYEEIKEALIVHFNRSKTRVVFTNFPN